MPIDFFRWEDSGALVHHCPHCQAPLASKRARLFCLGLHVEWCNKYHCQLFKAGNSAICRGCIHSDEQKAKRYREIAELVEKILPTSEQHPSYGGSPAVPKINHASIVSSGATKRERKEAKKVAKAAERAPVITAREIDRIGHILHPGESSNEQFERSLMRDKSIEDNVFYHAGTGNSRAMRHYIIQQQRSGKTELHISEAEMERIMLDLKVPTLAQASKSERGIVVKLREKITEDLIHVHGEEQRIMERKAGFWRWASRKAYNRLAANGRIWDWKNGDALALDTEPDADEMDQDAMSDEDETFDENISADVDNVDGRVDKDSDYRSLLSGSTATSHQASASSTSSSHSISASSISHTTLSNSDDEENDGWTVVGSKRPTKIQKLMTTPPKKSERAPLTLKLCANGGLGHLGAKGTPKTSTPRGWTQVQTASVGGGDEKYRGSFPPLSPGSLLLE